MARDSEAWHDLGGNEPAELSIESKRAMRQLGLGKPEWDKEIGQADRDAQREQEREEDRHFGAIAAEVMVGMDVQTDEFNRKKYLKQGMSEAEADQQVRLDRIAHERDRRRKA